MQSDLPLHLTTLLGKASWLRMIAFVENHRTGTVLAYCCLLITVQCMPATMLCAQTCVYANVCWCCCLPACQVVCEGRLYSRWLTRQLEEAGVHFVQRKLTSLAELAGEGWDVVFNCSGLGAKALLPDQNTYPIRGQIMRVKAPWVNQCVFAHFSDETAYIIPNR